VKMMLAFPNLLEATIRWDKVSLIFISSLDWATVEWPWKAVRTSRATNLPFDAKHVKVNDQRWSWLGSCVSPSC
jgi:hypothetical protein